MEKEKKVIGTCPLCQGEVYKTMKGWACECGFSLHGTILGRRITDGEAASILEGRAVFLDNLRKDNIRFSSTWRLDPKGRPSLHTDIASCPRCGGKMYVGYNALNCSNMSSAEKPCDFVLWRTYWGHELTVEEAEVLCRDGFTHTSVEFYGNDGHKYYGRLALSADKDQVIII